MKRMLVAMFLAVLVAGLAPAGAEPEDTMDLRESLRQTELAFAASVKDRDQEAFARFLADEAVFVGASVHRGRQAIVAAWQVFFGEDAPKLEWWPEIVEIGDGGDIGLTRGPYRLSYLDQDGKEQVSEGLFNSVWRLQEDGTWKIVFDMGCE